MVDGGVLGEFTIDLADDRVLASVVGAIVALAICGYFVVLQLWRRSVVRLADAAFAGQLWNRPASRADRKAQSDLAGIGVPIILVANHKGGVGKTTLALNLGMFFADARGKRVLFVDLDYQGSLSMTLRKMNDVDERDFRISDVFAVRDPARLRSTRPRVFDGDLAGSGFLDSDEGLAVLEERLMVSWAVGAEPS